jgi:Fe-S-cluster containining protein
MSSGSKRPFYSRGLRFTCHQCHNCCRGGQPGWVYPSRREIERIARRLKLTTTAFRRRYLVKDPDGEPSLRMRPNGDCIFWEEGCTIYPARPRQCKTFPFWTENLKSPQAWAEVRETCQGAGRGKLHRPEDIRAVLRGRTIS